MARYSVVYFHHIHDETTYLLSLTEKISFEEFLEDETFQRAAVRSLDIIGEASNKIPPEIREQHPDIEWSEMYKMRNRLIHGYFDVEPVLVWDTMIHDIPVLHKKIAEIL